MSFGLTKGFGRQSLPEKRDTVDNIPFCSYGLCEKNWHELRPRNFYSRARIEPPKNGLRLGTFDFMHPNS
jgi:hypothetical protein